MSSVSRHDLPLGAGAISRMMSELVGRQLERFHSIEGWSPAVNIYRLERRFEVCVELAGVRRETIDVRVEPGRLTIRGQRTAPEPARKRQEPMRIVAMEID